MRLIEGDRRASDETGTTLRTTIVGFQFLVSRIRESPAKETRGLMILDKEKEDFGNVNTPLSGLGALQAQALEHICSAGAATAVA
jgi:hypothetical protein